MKQSLSLIGKLSLLIYPAVSVSFYFILFVEFPKDLEHHITLSILKIQF